MSKTADKALFCYHLISLLLTVYFLWWGMFAAPKFEIDYLFHLTFLTQELLCFYYIWTLLQDYRNVFYPSPEKSQRYQDGTYTLLQILLPMTCLVTAGYWPMRLRDESLMLTEDGKGFPIILSLFNHGLNILFTSFETFLFEQKICKSFLWKFSVIMTGTMVYVSMQAIFQNVTGRPVYPFLAALAISEIAVFYAILCVFTLMAERVNTFLIFNIHKKAQHSSIMTSKRSKMAAFLKSKCE